MKKVKIFFVVVTICLICMFSFVSYEAVYATSHEGGGPPPPANSGGLVNPLSEANDLYTFIKLILDKVVMPVGGVVAVLAIMYAGFLFATAGGNETKIETARKAITYAVIGTAILLGSWVIATGIQGTINQLRGQGGAPAQSEGGGPPSP